jgi:hypothetical protein
MAAATPSFSRALPQYKTGWIPPFEALSNGMYTRDPAPTSLNNQYENLVSEMNAVLSNDPVDNNAWQQVCLRMYNFFKSNGLSLRNGMEYYGRYKGFHDVVMTSREELAREHSEYMQSRAADAAEAAASGYRYGGSRKKTRRKKSRRKKSRR